MARNDLRLALVCKRKAITSSVDVTRGASGHVGAKPVDWKEYGGGLRTMSEEVA